VTLKNEPGAKVELVAVRLPESEPPDCAATDGTVPLPMSMASELMVPALAASEPVMLRVAPLAVVVPEQVLTPASKTLPRRSWSTRRRRPSGPEICKVSPAADVVNVAGPFMVMPGSVSVPLLLKPSVTAAPDWEQSDRR